MYQYARRVIVLLLLGAEGGEEVGIGRTQRRRSAPMVAMDEPRLGAADGDGSKGGERARGAMWPRTQDMPVDVCVSEMG